MKLKRICRECGQIFYCNGICKDSQEEWQLQERNACSCLYCLLKKHKENKGKALTKEEFFLRLDNCCDLRKNQILRNPSYWKLRI